MKSYSFDFRLLRKPCNTSLNGFNVTSYIVTFWLLLNPFVSQYFPEYASKRKTCCGGEIYHKQSYKLLLYIYFKQYLKHYTDMSVTRTQPKPDGDLRFPQSISRFYFNKNQNCRAHDIIIKSNIQVKSWIRWCKTRGHKRKGCGGFHYWNILWQSVTLIYY